MYIYLPTKIDPCVGKIPAGGQYHEARDSDRDQASKDPPNVSIDEWIQFNIDIS